MPKIASPAVKAEVFAAVAASDGGRGAGFLRSDIVARFSESGVSQATLFRWIKEAMSGMAPSPPPPVEMPSKEVEIIRPPPTLRVAPVKVPVQREAMSAKELVRDSHRRMNAAIALAETEDGRLRNPRLLLAALEGRRRWVQTGHDIEDGAALDAFLEALTRAVKEEGQAVWDRVAARLRAVNQAHGYF